MQLKQLKLAGFKSFVDPTTLDFPSPLVAVVGPNGCGKSNIIDAIRWVMGESSAKHLRGDSMIDVIFNGSSNRKPVGQASVELIFDNTLGRIIGPFATYGEIAVKRVLTRDGDSTYYLNGTRCRRRDVMDIFLGTGAGVRGYSIISQGDVSRLIEAKPEALRGYLEEAAGVSKYKERRKETLTRIEHTRENLVRVADIREELGKQLQRLEKQAKTAERYVQLKEEERTCRAEILALKWRDLSHAQLLKQEVLQELAQTYAQEQLAVITHQKEKDLLFLKCQNLDIEYQDIQVAFYESGAEITRLQEGIAQFEREKNRIEADKHQLQMDHEASAVQLANYQSTLEIANQQAFVLQDNLNQLQVEMGTQEGLFLNANQQKNEEETLWQTAQNTCNIVKREAQIADVNWENNEQQRQQLLVRLEKIQMDAAAIDIDTLHNEAFLLNQQHIALSADHAQAVEKLRLTQEKIAQLRQQLADTEQQLRQLQDQYLQSKTQHAALSAAQGAATNSVKEYPIKNWTDKPRLVNILQVEEKWQFACECVLGDTLKALVLDKNDEFFPQMALLSAIGENIITLSPSKMKADRARLSDKIQGEHPLLPLQLDTIFLANSLAEATVDLQHLQSHESVITPEGYWLGLGWVRIPNLGKQDNLGLLARQQKIAALTLQLEDFQQKIEQLRIARDDKHNQLVNEEKHVQTLQAALNVSLDILRTHEAKQGINVKSLQYAQTRSQSLKEEGQELKLTLEDLCVKQQALSEKKRELNAKSRALEIELHALLENKHVVMEDLLQLQRRLESIRTEFHQSTLECDRVTNKIQQMQEGIIKEKERLNTFDERLEALMMRVMEVEKQQTTWHQKLTVALETHHQVEIKLQICKEQLAEEKQAQDRLEQSTKQINATIKSLEEKITQEKLDEQSLAVRIEAIQELLDEQSLNARDLLMNLAETITPQLRESSLSVIMEGITKLGAINLAAIDECREERARKDNLDAQYADLHEALHMLESAIEKMDKETQLRLENTFEQVNDLFKALFPRLFGGGKAQLELTSDNLLEAGIIVMAQPPGKRNSTIQLLSGGEKAMTAIALVFAIFQLNPSPFCMLDEVDAPLDDVNVVRFCNVVKEMSKFVQFLFITHNKVTMELAEQLIGVTMREPGVSRLVTVDMLREEYVS